MNLNPLANLDDIQPENLDTGPIVVLNLLKFKSAESLSSYIEYMVRARDAFGKGFELLYAGSLKERVQGDIGEWDVVLLARYPSRRNFYEMLRSEEYQSISRLREEALDNAILWPSEPILPYRTRLTEFEGGEWLELLRSQRNKMRSEAGRQREVNMAAIQKRSSS